MRNSLAIVCLTVVIAAYAFGCGRLTDAAADKPGSDLVTVSRELMPTHVMRGRAIPEAVVKKMGSAASDDDIREICGMLERSGPFILIYDGKGVDFPTSSSDDMGDCEGYNIFIDDGGPGGGSGGGDGPGGGGGGPGGGGGGSGGGDEPEEECEQPIPTWPEGIHPSCDKVIIRSDDGKYVYPDVVDYHCLEFLCRLVDRDAACGLETPVSPAECDGLLDQLPFMVLPDCLDENVDCITMVGP